ncbi:hypothetical protein [Halioxenophilus aromaticivorans]|uniref:Uncharacterized protein n=1 Tax=Halioxenophilus aromaticivorans TaxID=1306992 RepID=A0AAV3U4K1_9ALTE
MTAGTVAPARAQVTASLAAPLSVSLRYDWRESVGDRYQYRLRWYPSLALNEALSLHTFIASGDAFSSSYNTIDDSGADPIELRRAFVRYQYRRGKLEAGVIPPYKGRVSSTGLSKDGWLTGLRAVHQFSSKDQFEIVAGELSQPDNPGAFERLDNPNYWEAEYSSAVRHGVSFELAAEHMLGDDFVRGEVRKQLTPQWLASVESINKLGDTTKWVLSAGRTYGATKVFVYYSFVPQGFGQRAELTEDFVNYGHSWVLETDTKINQQLAWFTKFEHVKNNWRVQLGVSFSL